MTSSQLFHPLQQKELKRLAKAQQAQAALQAVAAASPAVAQPQPLRAVASSMPQKSASAIPQVQQLPSKSVGTPRPVSTAPRPGSTVPRPGSAVSKLGSTMRPTSAAPSNIKQEQKTLTLPVQIPGPTAMVVTPSRTATATPTGGDPHRGKKRDRDDGMLPNATMNGISAADTYVNGTTLNGIGNGNGISKLNAKAGSGGVRPRPSKKQRVVSF